MISVYIATVSAERHQMLLIKWWLLFVLRRWNNARKRNCRCSNNFSAIMAINRSQGKVLCIKRSTCVGTVIPVMYLYVCKPKMIVWIVMDLEQLKYRHPLNMTTWNSGKSSTKRNDDRVVKDFRLSYINVDKKVYNSLTWSHALNQISSLLMFNAYFIMIPDVI